MTKFAPPDTYNGNCLNRRAIKRCRGCFVYYEIYLDFYFLENLFMDGALLVLTGMMMKYRLKKRRIFMGAFLGSLVSVILLVLPLKHTFLRVAAELISAAGMITCSFEDCTGKRRIKGIAGLYLMSFLLEGAVQAISGKYRIPAAVLMGAAVLILGGFLVVYQTMQSQVQVQRNVTVTLHGRSKKIQALYDTGNRLREPYGQRPVNILEYQAAKELLEAEDTFFLVPCRTVSGSSQMLEAMTFERMLVEANGRTKEIERPVIAFAKERLSSDGSYQMILHPDNSDD